MPDAGARRRLFSGASAGGAGATLNANHAAELIVAGAAGVVPRVRLVSDAATSPYEPDAANGVDQAEVDAYRAGAAVTQAMFGALPESLCSQAHPGDPEGVCSAPAHVLAHHMTLSAFLQMDVEDNTVGPWLYDSFALFGQSTRPLLAAIADGSVLYGSEPAAQTQVGVFAPRCCHQRDAGQLRPLQHRRGGSEQPGPRRTTRPE